MSRFQSADVVECIDDIPVRPETRVMPRLGQRYTVTRTRQVGDGHSVRLLELHPTCHLGGPCRCGECGWDASRFRKCEPLEEQSRARTKGAPVAA
jgi:hypothetical protein